MAIVLALSVAFTAIESEVSRRLERRLKTLIEERVKRKKAELQKKGLTQEDAGWKVDVSKAERDAQASAMNKHGVIDFLHLLISIAKQIAFSIAVQLLAASARAREPSRIVRVLTLLGLVVFFLFVQSNSQRRLI